MSQQNIALVGPSGTGKDAIVDALDNQAFLEAYNPTEAIDFRYFPKGSQGKVGIWLASGEKSFKSMTLGYLKTSTTVYLVLDAQDFLDANNQKIEALKHNWITWVTKNTPNETPIGLIINKLDLISSIDIATVKNNVNSLLDEDDLKNQFLPEILYCSAKTPNDPGIAQLKSSLLPSITDVKVEKSAPIQKAPEQSPFNKFLFFFQQPDTLRNLFPLGMLGIIGIILLGALGGPLAPGLYFGLLLIFNILATVGICASFLAVGLTLSTTHERRLSTELLEWAENHRLDITVGILLFLATVALIVITVFFPLTLANMPFLSAAINFVSSGIAGVGLAGISTTLMTALSASLIGIFAITLWDVLCRVGNTLYSAAKINYPEELSWLEDTLEQKPRIGSTQEISNQPTTISSPKEYPTNKAYPSSTCSHAAPPPTHWL
jgi:GTPase SAR1 family protein